ncbi:MAG: hypothetical protein MUF14_07955 [Hyphomonadaceae bacterium]|nr:hypothetical protein [Hyphomonadaceae bacterium]
MTGARGASRLKLALGIALAELRGGVKGFRLFLACLAIGIAAIAASGSMAEAFRLGLEKEQREILGGDLALGQRLGYPTDDIRAFFDERGTTSLTVETRTMGNRGELRRLIDVRAVDDAHPLQGAVELAPALPLTGVLEQRNGVWGAAAEQALLDLFDLKVGDRFALPYGEVEIRAVLVKEPDALGRGFALSPRLMIATAALPDLRLAQEGSLYSTSLRVALDPGQTMLATSRAFGAAFPARARDLRDSARSADGFGRALDRVELFLGCVGFAALLAGGLGVAGAVRGHLETRRTSIAVLKTLGASVGDIRLAYGIQIGIMALFGALIGLTLGAAAPFAVAAVYGASLPVPVELALFPIPLAAAAATGLLAAVAFAAMPLGAARATPPTALLRGGGGLGRAPWAETVFSGAGLVLLASVFAATSRDPVMALGLAAGAAGAWVLFWGWGRIAQMLARRAPARGGTWGLALANLGGPGSMAPAAAPALGLGLALLVGLGQVQSNLVTQVRDTAPDRAPSIAFTEIPDGRQVLFDRTVIAAAGRTLPAETYARTPVLTVRLLALNGKDLVLENIAPSERWIVQSDITGTWLANQPQGAELTAGDWWPGDWNDPFEARVSLESEAAAGMGAKVGDMLLVSVSGREIEARIDNLRKVDWAGFGANFAVIFAPGPFEGAAFRHAAIARLSPDEEARVTSALAKDFPSVTIIRVRDALAAAGDLFESLALAIQAVAAVALAAGGAAVAGAMAAGARRRVYDAAILKALGASRARVLGAFALFVLEADWALDPVLVATIVVAAAAAFALAGLMTGLAAMRQSPARVLAAAAELR